MPKRVHAKRYAQAVFELARERMELERWGRELEELALLAGDPVVVTFLENPRIPFSQKSQLLTERLGGLSPLTLNLVFLLVSRRRISALGAIAREYQALLDHYQGIERAEVTTAVPAEGQILSKVAGDLSLLLEKKIILEPKVDPAVLGGVVVRVGGKLIDGSVRSRLAALKQNLARLGT